MKKIERVLFVGSKQLGLNCLKTMYSLSKETLVGAVTFDDSADGRGKLADFKAFCSQHKIPLFV
ncbi:MAG TPA: hypothetical protein PLQ65_16525, partial [Flavihumibacter sp.]|nr:hypothetical protein [Flavihumibacter sp.]